jgi:hypothetical protein
VETPPVPGFRNLHVPKFVAAPPVITSRNYFRLNRFRGSHQYIILHYSYLRVLFTYLWLQSLLQWQGPDIIAVYNCDGSFYRPVRSQAVAPLVEGSRYYCLSVSKTTFSTSHAGTRFYTWLTFCIIVVGLALLLVMLLQRRCKDSIPVLNVSANGDQDIIPVSYGTVALLMVGSRYYMYMPLLIVALPMITSIYYTCLYYCCARMVSV